MKKIKYLLFSFLFLIAILISLHPLNVSADSGACSDHGGVNCATGPDYNGKVVCNDGWTNSSVYYQTMDECVGVNACPRYLNTQEYATEYNSIRSQMNEIQKTLDSENQMDKSLCASFIAQGMNLANQFHQTYTPQPCPYGPTGASIKILSLMIPLQKELDCLKQLPKVITPAITQQGLEELANEIRNRTPEQKQKDSEEACKKDQEWAKNDPIGFAEYKKGLTELGIQMSDCSTNLKTTPIPVNSSVKKTSPNQFSDIFKDSTTPVIQQEAISEPTIVPAPKITFWNRVGNFFKKLKFW